MSRYDVNVILYRLKKDATFRTRFQASPETVLAGADLTDEEYLAFVRWDTRRLNELGGSLTDALANPRPRPGVEHDSPGARRSGCDRAAIDPKSAAP